MVLLIIPTSTMNRSLILALGCCLLLAACDSPLAPDASADAGLLDAAAPAEARSGQATMNKMLADVRKATARYHRVEVAEDAGYTSTVDCAAHPTEGAMGVHYVNFGLLGDAAYSLTEPEVLVYEPTSNGRMRLGAVEYLIWHDAWTNAGHAGPPMFGDVAFDEHVGTEAHGLPDHYELHVWLWRHNPSGLFASWNPTVSCPAP